MTRTAVAEAKARYSRKRYKQMREGTWRGLVDATPARQHVRNMRRIWGISYESLAVSVGLSRSVVYYLMDGKPSRDVPPPARISARVSDAIVRFTVEDLPGYKRITAIGSTRRLQALAIAGWPAHEIARRAKADKTGLRNVRAGQATITADLAHKIQKVFEELIRLNPADHLSAASIATTTSRAVKAGWLPARAWAGEFDDPDTTPWTGVRCSHPDCPRGSRDERELCGRHLDVLAERGTLDGTRVNKGDVLVDEARLLLAADDTYIDETGELLFEHLAWRLGTTEDALDRLLSRRQLTRRDLLPAEAVGV